MQTCARMQKMSGAAVGGAEAAQRRRRRRRKSVKCEKKTNNVSRSFRRRESCTEGHRSMGAKLSGLPGTGETDPERFEWVTLGTTRASAVGIGCQLIVRRRRHAARLRAVVARFKPAARATPPPLSQMGHSDCDNGVATGQSGPLLERAVAL